MNILAIESSSKKLIVGLYVEGDVLKLSSSKINDTANALPLLTKQILKNRNINLIASGGIGSIYDVLTMKKLGANECIVGKAIYENKISLKELLNVNK